MESNTTPSQAPQMPRPTPQPFQPQAPRPVTPQFQASAPTPKPQQAVPQPPRAAAPAYSPVQRPPTPPMANAPTPHRHSSVGPIIGSIVILILLVIGGLYFWGRQLSMRKDAEIPETSQQENQQQVETPTDEISDIEGDLNEAGAVGSYDSDFADIEAALNEEAE